MNKLFEWIKQGAGKRVLQLTVLQNGKFEACVIEGNGLAGNMVAKATATTGDGALVSLAISVMNLRGVSVPGDGKGRVEK